MISEGNELVVKKMVLLYLADRLPSLTQDEFMKAALDTIYIDYFDFGVLYQQLLADGFLYEAQRKGETSLDANGVPAHRVDITSQGQQILESLYQTVPLPMRKHLQESTRESLQVKLDEEMVKAQAQPDLNGAFRVSLGLQGDDRSQIIDCQFTVPTKEMADIASKHWKEHYETLYPQILKLLLGPSEEQKATSDSD